MVGMLMKRRQFVFALAAFALGGILSFPANAADVDKIDLSKVPAKIKDAASKAVPGAKWTGASKHLDDGKVTYELEGEDSAGGYVSAELTADAKVNEVGFEIAIEKVPAIVTGALQKKMPRFKVATAYEARKEGEVIRYDFEGKRPRDKKELTVSVSTNGKEIEIDES
jgi:hypothetical protein